MQMTMLQTMGHQRRERFHMKRVKQKERALVGDLDVKHPRYHFICLHFIFLFSKLKMFTFIFIRLLM